MIVEHHTFALAEGVSEDQFLAADARVQQEFAPFHEGFIRRTTAKAVDGERWLVSYFWFDADSADAAAAAGATDDAVRALVACSDGSSVSIARYETLD